MKNNFILLCCLLACFIFSGNSGRAAQDSFPDQEIMMLIANNDYQKALILLNTAIDKNQENIFALEIRSQVFLLLGEVNKSLDDINTILDKDITRNGMLIYRCVIKESQTKKYLMLWNVMPLRLN